MLKNITRHPLGRGLSQHRWGHRNIRPFQESNPYPPTFSVTLQMIHMTANLVLVRENLPQIHSMRYVNSPHSSDVRGVRWKRSAKRMTVNPPAAAAAARGKFSNDIIHDSLVLSSTAGQSPMLKVALTLHTNWRIRRLLICGVITHVFYTPFSLFLLPRYATVIWYTTSSETSDHGFIS